MARSLQFIKKVTGEGVGTLDVSDCFSSEFDNYELYIPKVDLSGNAYLNLRFLKASDGSVDSTSNYDSAGEIFSATGSGDFSELRYTNSSAISNVFGLSNIADFNNGGLIRIFNPFSSSSYSFIQSQMVGWGGAFSGAKNIGVHKVEQSNSGIQIILANMTFVQALMYGVKS